MAVYKRGKNYWIAFYFNNHRYRKRCPENSYKGAQAYEALLRQRLARGQPLNEPKLEKKPAFREVSLQWLNIYVKNNNKHSEYQIRRYVLNSHLIPYFGPKPVDEISTYKIEQYKAYLLNEKHLSPKSINNQLCILSRCLKSAVEWNIIKEIPKIKLLKVPPQKYDFLNETETEILLQNSNGQLHDMILLAVRTGLRFGELIALRWEDINFQERTLTVRRNIVRGIEGSPKNNRTRIIPLTQSVIEMLRKSNKESKYIFYNSFSRPLRYNPSLEKLHKISQLAGLRRISWHMLRHSFASHLAARNNSIVAIKELLGHSDVKTTMRYAHVNLPVLQNAVESLEPGFQEIATILPQPKKVMYAESTYH